MLESYFVYVGAGRHIWRFVHFAAAARDGDQAIEEATAEARAMGNEPAETYLAVPASACTTRRCDRDGHTATGL